MRESVVRVRGLPAWQALWAHHANARGLHLRQPFVADSGRGERMALERVGACLT